MALWLPNRIVAGAVAIALLASALVLWTVLSQPWLGLTLKADSTIDTVRIVAVDPSGPARAAGVVPARLVSIAAPGTAGPSVVLEDVDVIEEPDLIGTYEEMQRLYARQSAAAGLLGQGPVVLTLRHADGQTRSVTVTPAQRPLGTLPVAFWIQLITGVGGLLISAWVLALRPADLATRLFTASGAMLMLSAHAAAIYSSRELAIDGGLFRVLSALNHVGALGFGMAMIALFLSYPRPLVRPRLLLLIPAVFGTWLATDIAHVAPSPALGSQLPTALEMLLIIVCIGVQWFANRADPHARAALRWLGLSVTLGAGAFILLIITPILVESAPAMEQGHAFGFFLLIYAGIALGISRYRLFDIEDWAYRITFYTFGVMVLLSLDAVLITLLNLQRDVSFGLSLLAIAFLYLPLREKLWTRLIARRPVESHELFRSVIDLAFAASVAERSARWKALLQTLFDPLVIEPAGRPVSQVEVLEEGLALAVPAVADTPPLVIRYPWRGRRLIGSANLQLATDLVQLMDYAESSRDAYERGSLEERRRIARDLHDDVGARLLSGLHKTDVADTHRLLRDAIADIRTVVSGLSDGRAGLGELVAALRHETGERLEAAGIELNWPLTPADDSEAMLEYRVYRNLVSAHREAISNVIRHAGARTVEVGVTLDGGLLAMTVRDDGVGLDARPRRDGNGIPGMERRLAEAGGTFAFAPMAAGTCLTITLPLRAAADAAAPATPPQSRGVSPAPAALESPDRGSWRFKGLGRQPTTS